MYKILLICIVFISPTWQELYSEAKNIKNTQHLLDLCHYDRKYRWPSKLKFVKRNYCLNKRTALSLIGFILAFSTLLHFFILFYLRHTASPLKGPSRRGITRKTKFRHNTHDTLIKIVWTNTGMHQSYKNPQYTWYTVGNILYTYTRVHRSCKTKQSEFQMFKGVNIGHSRFS